MIAPMMLSSLSQRCGGQIFGADVAFETVSTDTRTQSAGDLFVALAGERFDGNRFAVQAAKNDACAVVVSKQLDINVSQLVTNDTLKALGEIGAFCREQFNKPVLAITGSSGKTTARRMLTAILETQGPVCSNFANQNNEVGVPLTLLTLSNRHESAVIEMGARHLGDIAYLGNFVKPDVAILLNAGTAHIGEFGGYQNIVKGKGEIYLSLNEQGCAIVNLDDPASSEWLASLNGKRVLTFSLDDGGSADVTASDIRLESEHVEFFLCYKDEKVRIKLAAIGRHNVSNALASAAAAMAIGVSLDDVAAGLSQYRSESGRSHLVVLKDGLQVIDDCYNANPASAKAALEALELQSAYRVAVIGEMGELGDGAEALHEEVANFCNGRSIEEYWFIGSHAERMAEVVGEKARVFKEKKMISEAIEKCWEDQTKRPLCVLLKASRFMALESVLSDIEGSAS